MSGEQMLYPKNINEFIEQYSFADTKREYTNGIKLIPVFRVEQAIEHYIHNKMKKCFVCNEKFNVEEMLGIITQTL